MNDRNAQPIYFGPPSRALFGWLHRPPAGVASTDLGLVLCNAFGFEELCSHRTMRHIAMAASRLGISCIRFDYDGTGDSIGDDFDSNRVTAWIDSIHAAADEVKSRTGVTRICLLGIRMGSLLAASAAQRRNDICGLALILPTVKPGSYLREIRTLHATTLNLQPGDLGDGDASITESAGFLMTQETTLALEKLSCTGSELPPADVLIMDRDDLPNAHAVAEQLREKGARVVYAPTSDHELVLKTPEILQLPVQILNSCSNWMQQISARGGISQPPTASAESLDPHESRTRIPLDAGTSRSADDFIEEVAVCTGPHRRFSITTLPGTRRSVHSGTRGQRGILLVNTGATHHVGPSGMYVALARQWARLGYVVMRLDRAGIGDSPAPPGTEENVVYSAHPPDDVIAASTQLRDQYGVTEMMLLGFCSGAYCSFAAATRGVALKGIVLINPFVFYVVSGVPIDMDVQSPRSYVAALEAARYRKSVLKWSTWKKFLTGQVDLRSFLDTGMHHVGAILGTTWRNAARRVGVALCRDLPRDLRRIDACGTRIVMVFGSCDRGLPHVRDLGGSPLRRLIRQRKVDFHVIDGADHIFMQLKHRRVLQRLLTDRVRALLPG